MNRNETFRDYFRRARYDKNVSAQLLRTAKSARKFFGWIVIVFVALTVWECADQLLHGAGWLSRSVLINVVGLVTNLLIYDKLGERIIALEVLAESPNQSTEPTLASGTSPARQEPRLP
jgi:hypothetical protein